MTETMTATVKHGTPTPTAITIIGPLSVTTHNIALSNYCLQQIDHDT